MIYLSLFLTFFEIGLFTFGGGYAMISIVFEKVLAHGWLTEAELLNMIAVAESTPGPIAVNMATFIGSSQGGALGALCATLGVVLPSFIIILLIASIFTRLLKYAGVKVTLKSIRPAIIALILGTAITMLLSLVFGIKTFGSTIDLDLKRLVIFAIIAVGSVAYKKWRGSPIQPILLILISGILGMLLYR